MASTEATAAAAAAVIPFHCIICFEAFSLDEHPPVVLPCGHTYVCMPCAKRLKRCMECREPLYWTPPTNSAVKQAPLMPMPTTRLRTVGGGLRYPPSPPHPAALLPMKPPEQLPLPIPKNAVLLTMMEAAQQQARLANLRNDDAVIDNDDDDTDNEHEQDITQQDYVRLGIEALSGPCGTYVVRDPEGLAVLPFDPRRGAHYHLQGSEEKKSEEVREPFSICMGQTVQVINFDDGIAKLARGAGFIVASHQQLVKVGGPLDRSCKLEGLVQMVEFHRRNIELKLEEMKCLEQSLRRQVDREQFNEPTHPIVSDLPAEECVPAEELSDHKQRPHSPYATLKGLDFVEAAKAAPKSPKDSFQIDAVDNMGVGYLSGCGCSPHRSGKVSPNTIVNCGDHMAPFPRYRQSLTDDDDIREFAFGCGSSFFGEQELGTGKDVEEITGLSFDSIEDIRAPRLVQHAFDNRSNHVPSPTPFHQSASLSSPSFDNLNFRTGMSGHRGLSATKASSPRSKQVTRVNFRMMSEHKGIGRIRGPTNRRAETQSPSFGSYFSPQPNNGFSG